MENTNRNTPCRDWSGCTNCRLHATRRNVIVRGQWIVNTINHKPIPGTHPHIHPILPLSPGNEGAAWRYLANPPYPASFTPYQFPTLTELPPHILIIGEAPGESEDFHGRPFYGKAGHILRTTLDYAKTQFLATLTNTVCCRPVNEEGGNRQPEVSEQIHCLPHTQELLLAYTFQGAILLGKVAEEYNTQFIQTKLPTLHLMHPAAIARQNYKLKTIREQARKIELWVKSLKTGKPFFVNF